jgi:hypothetical protein
VTHLFGALSQVCPVAAFMLLHSVRHVVFCIAHPTERSTRTATSNKRELLAAIEQAGVGAMQHVYKYAAIAIAGRRSARGICKGHIAVVGVLGATGAGTTTPNRARSSAPAQSGIGAEAGALASKPSPDALPWWPELFI